MLLHVPLGINLTQLLIILSLSKPTVPGSEHPVECQLYDPQLPIWSSSHEVP